MNQQLRSKLWSIVAKKKTKSDFFEVSAIVTEIENIITNERLQGVQDAIEHLQIDAKYDPAIAVIRQGCGIEA